MSLIPYITNRVYRPETDLASLLGCAAASASGSFRFHQDKDNYVAQVDLPGVTKESLQLEAEGEVLTLTAEREVGFADAKRKVSQTRTLTLPDDVHVEAIQADLKDGVLTLTFPKREESKPKHLKISVN